MTQEKVLSYNLFSIAEIIKPLEYDKAYFQDKVLLENTNFKNIFGNKLKSKLGFTNSKRLRIVKITIWMDKVNKSIYREFFGANSLGVKQNEVYLNFESLSELGYNSKVGIYKIVLTKGSKFNFFWFHPQLNTRVTYKFAVYSLSVTLFSLIISIISLGFAIIPFFK